MSREKVLSRRFHRGLEIEHVESWNWRGTGWGWGRNHAARYVRRTYWWIKALEWDEPTFAEAAAVIDRRYPGEGVLVEDDVYALIGKVGA